jgi:hypothetical protein
MDVAGAQAGVGFQQDWTSIGRVNIQQRQRKDKYHEIVQINEENSTSFFFKIGVRGPKKSP